MICHNCKAEIAGSPKFCPKCGANIQAAVVPVSDTAIDTPTIAQSSSAQTSPAPSAVSDAMQGSVICPTCGTANLATARFCKKDATPLSGTAAVPQSVAPGITLKPALRRAAEQPQPPYQRTRQPAGMARKSVLFAGVAVVAVATFVAGALYWSGYIGDRQGSVSQKINAELSSKNLGNVKITVAKDWNAVVEGMVSSQADKEKALALIKQHGELKADVIDSIRVKPSRAEMEVLLNKALADAGMKQVTAQIDEGFTTITLDEAALAPENRAKAEQLMTSTATAASGVAPVKFTYAEAKAEPPLPQADATLGFDGAAVARTLNEQLRHSGLSGVSVRVDASGNANLQGTVASHDDKDRAIQLALSHQGVAGVGDFIQVAPQAAGPAPLPRVARPTPPTYPNPITAPVASKDPAKLEGDINRALRNGGASGVTAQVAEDFSVTLKGSATSAGQKNRAFQIAQQFGVKGTPKDRIFVVEQ